MNIKKNLKLFVLMLTALSSLFVSSTAGEAAHTGTCRLLSGSYHCYSEKWLNPTTATGIHFYTMAPVFILGGASIQFSNAIWIRLTNGDVLEAGVTTGSDCPFQLCAYTAVNGNLLEYIQVTANEALHHFWITSDRFPNAQGTWVFIMDGYTFPTGYASPGVYTSSNLADSLVTGGELQNLQAPPDPFAYTHHPVKTTSLQYEDTAHVWHNWGTNWDSLVDYPCPTTPGRCFTGVSPASSSWTWSKP